MRRFHRVALSLTLTIATLFETGCTGLMMQPGSGTCSRSEIKMNAARLEESRGNLLEAKKLYAEVKKIDPQNGDCSYRLAMICTLLNQHEEAEVFYEQAYASHSGDAEFLSEMGIRHSCERTIRNPKNCSDNPFGSILRIAER